MELLCNWILELMIMEVGIKFLENFMHGRLIEDCHCDKEMTANAYMGILKLQFFLKFCRKFFGNF